MVIVFRSLEYDRFALEHVGAVGVGEKSFPKLLVDHTDFHHRAVEQIARHHDIARGWQQRGGVGPNHLTVAIRYFGEVFCQCPACYGPNIAVQFAGGQQFFHHGWHAPGAMEFLAEESAGGL